MILFLFLVLTITLSTTFYGEYVQKSYLSEEPRETFMLHSGNYLFCLFFLVNTNILLHKYFAVTIFMVLPLFSLVGGSPKFPQ